jgi:hypothetical protein
MTCSITAFTSAGILRIGVSSIKQQMLECDTVHPHALFSQVLLIHWLGRVWGRGKQSGVL